ncbi:unnamed protein product [Microthlaspi erraticum]|uniref:Transmembrane protein n=1 Tax=Microthlaspi erraticum TaxID=1685480 RepID=A0A6D2HTA1_9BRAS|nr:unnamed protein product [Microthlaspi erraticum]
MREVPDLVDLRSSLGDNSLLLGSLLLLFSEVGVVASWFVSSDWLGLARFLVLEGFYLGVPSGVICRRRIRKFVSCRVMNLCYLFLRASLSSFQEEVHLRWLAVGICVFVVYGIF